jgi:hypothetical protein
MQSETLGKLVSEKTSDGGKQENNSSGGKFTRGLLGVEVFQTLKLPISKCSDILLNPWPNDPLTAMVSFTTDVQCSLFFFFNSGL